ncbi:progestin and adipoQ receptor family member 4 isoform X1 [Canis aureus]
MAFLAGPRLLDWASSPPHLQFNKFVLTGYRPASSGSGCLRSLFYLHNELGNIYTHGLALLGFLVLLPMTMPWGQLGQDGWLGGTHCVACLAPPAGSVLYHLFMCHQGGSAVYTRLLALDMCGVCLVNTLAARRRRARSALGRPPHLPPRLSHLLPATSPSLQSPGTDDRPSLLLVCEGLTPWMLPANWTSQLEAITRSSDLPCGLASSTHVSELWLPSLPSFRVLSVWARRKPSFLGLRLSSSVTCEGVARGTLGSRLALTVGMLSAQSREPTTLPHM